MTGYVNGTSIGTAGQTGTVHNSAVGLKIGCNGSSGGGCNGQFWSGFIDEVRVASTNRSSDWIATEYNNQSDPYAFYRILPVEQPVDVLRRTRAAVRTPLRVIPYLDDSNWTA